jgi:hypothetical protein
MHNSEITIYEFSRKVVYKEDKLGLYYIMLFVIYTVDSR